MLYFPTTFKNTMYFYHWYRAIYTIFMTQILTVETWKREMQICLLLTVTKKKATKSHMRSMWIVCYFLLMWLWNITVDVWFKEIIEKLPFYYHTKSRRRSNRDFLNFAFSNWSCIPILPLFLKLVRNTPQCRKIYGKLKGNKLPNT